ncbi:Ig-like domain-containing protein [Bradyrhizobium yuanmingense]|uniref:Ig-like domain-containing protein n=1 Tax=Bradyrhizobium yuanmingense TaxID=108015 RepID=UPI0023B88C4D|nr:Ig-like domain-containing protein [Bradyrhizobium yuanmingense]MDF0578230.1 Ig-like domain-containing protein [Bradyrhizobium yuanmingense]
MGISLAELIKQNTLGQSEGYPAGVPHSWNWYKGWNPDGLLTPPADFTAVEGWGQVYTEEGAPASPNANVELANAKTYVHIKETGEWLLVQDQSKLGIAGGHFVPNFNGNSGYPMTVTRLPSGAVSFDAPPAGYNDHFWQGARGTYTAGTVDGVYVQMDMRTTDPNAKLVGMVGVDWWRNASAPYLDDHSANPAVGVSNWVELSTQWKTIGYYSMSTAAFQADLPPPLLGSPQTPPVQPSDTIAPASPKLVAVTPDTGTAGDQVTNAKQLTLSGTAEAGSTVKVFEGTSVVGTVKAGANGTWSLTTAQLADGNHTFNATATDAAGNVSQKSASLSARVDTLAPAAPKITAFAPDNGTVAARMTNTGRLTLSGTAEAGSTVRVLEGTTVIGTTKAGAGGAWSLTTAQLAAGRHAFTAMATDAAGNVSTKSAGLNVTVNGPVTSPPANGKNLLVNGSFEATAVADGRWGAYKSVSGWTAISGGTIELWNNHSGVKASDGANFGELDYLGARDGFYQDVKTVAGQVYQLSFDARTRPGFNSATCSIEVLWNGSVVAAVPPGSAWDSYDFKVVGTGGNDRLTFREVSSQGSDGLGALYDNIELTVATATPPTQIPEPTGKNLLVNGSFESSSLAPLQGGRWGAFDSVPGWHAISGGTIELWNNLNGVKASDGGNFGELDYVGARDGLYQDVKTVAGQQYDLSFDARSRPGFSSSTCSIEVLWNGSVVGVVPPGADWKNYDFTVTGTGGQDRLTFREVAGQGGDGLGALYDNVSLVAKTPSSTSASLLSSTSQAVALMNQFAATDGITTSAMTNGPLATDTSALLTQTLSLPAQH